MPAWARFLGFEEVITTSSRQTKGAPQLVRSCSPEASIPLHKTTQTRARSRSHFGSSGKIHRNDSGWIRLRLPAQHGASGGHKKRTKF
jgi:hypothetical protein